MREYKGPLNGVFAHTTTIPGAAVTSSPPIHKADRSPSPGRRRPKRHHDGHSQKHAATAPLPPSASVQFPPIRRARKEKEKKDAVGRRLIQPSSSAKRVRNLINQCALNTLLSAKGLVGGAGGYVSPHEGGGGGGEEEEAFAQLTSPRDDQGGILAEIKRCTASGCSRINLADSGLTDAGMIVLSNVARTHPTLTALDLSGILLRLFLIKQLVVNSKNIGGQTKRIEKKQKLACFL